MLKLTVINRDRRTDKNLGTWACPAPQRQGQLEGDQLMERETEGLGWEGCKATTGQRMERERAVWGHYWSCGLAKEST